MSIDPDNLTIGTPILIVLYKVGVNGPAAYPAHVAELQSSIKAEGIVRSFWCQLKEGPQGRLVYVPPNTEGCVWTTERDQESERALLAAFALMT